MTITPSSGTMTMKKASILVKGSSEEKIKGDVNADGKFNIADAVVMQKWLIQTPEAELADWTAGDIYEDKKIDVFDLCLIKKELTKIKI